MSVMRVWLWRWYLYYQRTIYSTPVYFFFSFPFISFPCLSIHILSTLCLHFWSPDILLIVTWSFLTNLFHMTFQSHLIFITNPFPGNVQVFFLIHFLVAYMYYTVSSDASRAPEASTSWHRDSSDLFSLDISLSARWVASPMLYVQYEEGGLHHRMHMVVVLKFCIWKSCYSWMHLKVIDWEHWKDLYDSNILAGCLH